MHASLIARNDIREDDEWSFRECEKLLKGAMLEHSRKWCKSVIFRIYYVLLRVGKVDRYYWVTVWDLNSLVSVPVGKIILLTPK